MAKEGVVGLTRTAARELGRFGIRANAIRPMAITLQVGEYHDETARWRRLMDLTMGASTNDTDPASATPAMVAPFVVWLCTDAASGVNGRTFFVSGDQVMLLSEPKAQATIAHEGGWDLDALDAVAPTELVAGLTNRFLLADHPDMQVFDDDGTS